MKAALFASALALSACALDAGTDTAALTGDPWTPTTFVPSPTPCKGADGIELTDLYVYVPCEQSANVVRAALDGSGWTVVATGLTGIEDVAIGDLDADGEPDMVAALDNGAGVVALRGPGFTTRITLRTGNHYMQVGIADMDSPQDGYPDITAGARNVSSTNSAAGYLRRVPGVDAWTAGGWTWVQAALSGWTMTLDHIDWEGDGDLDFFRMDRSGAGNSPPLKGAWWDEHTNGGGWVSHHIAFLSGDPGAGDARDDDGDGTIDHVIAGTRAGATNSIIEYESIGGAWTASSNLYPADVGDFHAATYCPGIGIVATFALSAPGESWIAAYDGAVWSDISGPADVTRKPDQAVCRSSGAVWVAEGDGGAPQNDRGAERWEP